MGGFHTWNRESSCYASSQSLKNEEGFNTLLQIIRPHLLRNTSQAFFFQEIWKEFFMWTIAPWFIQYFLFCIYPLSCLKCNTNTHLEHMPFLCNKSIAHIGSSKRLSWINGLSIPYLLPIVLHLKVVIWCKNKWFLKKKRERERGAAGIFQKPSFPLSAQAVQILARFNVSNRPCRIPDSSTLPTRLIHGASIEYRGRRGWAGVVRGRKEKEIEML